MRNVGALVLWVTLVVALVACGVRPMPRRFFSLAPEAPQPERATTRPRLRVADLECAEEYDQELMVYRLSPVEARPYRYNRWLSKPGIMIGEVVRRYLAASGRFSVVTAEETADVELRGRVDVLEHLVRDRRWHGHLAMELSLRRLRDDRVVWRYRIEGTEEAARPDVAEVVAAASRVLGEGLAEALPSLSDAAIEATVGPPAGTQEAPPRREPARTD